MPTYEYVCDACEHTFEEFQSITAKSLRKCPACGKNKLRRLIGTGAGVIFKGSGFYETDYRSDSYKSAAKADKPESKDSKPVDGSAKDVNQESKSNSGQSSDTRAKTKSAEVVKPAPTKSDGVSKPSRS